MLARAIADAREATGLSYEQFAGLLALSPATVRAWESGESPIAAVQLEMVARLFGMDIPQFLETDLRTKPSALLYRSMAQGGALERFSLDRLAHQLGDFLYCVRVVSECERLAGESSASLAWLDELGPEPLAAASRPPHGAEELAATVRARLGLGLEPIPSMRFLLRGRGVELFFADPDMLHPAVAAACTLVPRPAILVNVMSGGDKWWHTRMSLVHELAHLCFDSNVLGEPRRLFLFSPVERRSWQPVARFEALEQRANAFAAYFLAPRALVERLIPRSASASPEALHELRRRCGLGHETAANLLKNIFGLSDLQHNALLAALTSRSRPNTPTASLRRGCAIQSSSRGSSPWCATTSSTASRRADGFASARTSRCRRAASSPRSSERRS
jgi:transcriptional regulator with XRE-family HTH domain